MGRLRETTGDYGQTTGKLRGVLTRLGNLNFDRIRRFSVMHWMAEDPEFDHLVVIQDARVRSEVSPLEASGRIKHVEQG
jgi:hypothetical protein